MPKNTVYYKGDTMPNIEYEGKKINYSVYGRGKPIVFLNGIFMSIASWEQFIPTCSKNNQLILIDFIDQGKSDSASEQYTQALQIEIIQAVLTELNLKKVTLMGISYGGEVALGYILKYPAMVEKLIIANSALNTDFWLREIGKSWEYSYESRDGRQFFKTCIPIVYSPEFFSKNETWAKNREEVFVNNFTDEIYDRFLRLTRSSEDYDVRDRIGEVKVPTLIISSENDFITPISKQREIVSAIKHASHVVIQGAGHASMYEKPDLFASLILGFTNLDSEINIM